MERFDPRALIAAMETLQIWRLYSPSASEEPLSEETFRRGKIVFHLLKGQCEDFGFHASLATIERELTQYRHLDRPPTRSEFAQTCEELSGRFSDELRGVYLMA
ncbi:MAG TPA: hypothetical protein VIC28_12540, partial [Thermoanaerobaculia bacterium]